MILDRGIEEENIYQRHCCHSRRKEKLKIYFFLCFVWAGSKFLNLKLFTPRSNGVIDPFQFMYCHENPIGVINLSQLLKKVARFTKSWLVWLTCLNYLRRFCGLLSPPIYFLQCRGYSNCVIDRSKQPKEVAKFTKGVIDKSQLPKTEWS